MSAVAKEESPAKGKKGASEVGGFLKKYDEALEEAKRSALHTATEGWQELYGKHKKDVEQRRKQIGTILHDAAKEIERGTTNDTPEEAIASAKKLYASLRIDVEVFNVRTVKPVREPVLRCTEVIEQARREARENEARTPLILKGLKELIEEAIEGVEQVDWDADSGQVVIKPAK